MAIHVVTVATESKFYFPYLVESCRIQGVELEVLGYGETWRGYNWRLQIMLDYLQKLPEDDIVCFVDGYDVICCRNLYELKDEFIRITKETNAKIVVGHTQTSFYMNFLTYIDFGLCKGTSLNAGTYIGFVKDLKNIIREIYNINPDDNADDQQLMTKHCKLNNSYYIDTDAKLFLTLSYPLSDIRKHVNITPSKTCNGAAAANKLERNGNYPFFVHSSGNGYLDNIIKDIGYPYETSNIKNELYWDFIDKSIFHVRKFLYQKLVYILVLIMLLFLLYTYFSRQRVKNLILKGYKKNFGLSKIT
jgi:hypothetical protein